MNRILIKPLVVMMCVLLFPIRWNLTIASPPDNAMKHYSKGDYESALKEYDKLLSKHPDWEEIHFGKGTALYKSNKIDDAIREFEQAISLKDDKQKSAVFYNIANSLFQKQRVQESLQFYKRALQLNPDDFDAKHNFELAKMMMQQQEKQQKQDQKPDQQQGEEKEQEQQKSQQEQKEQEEQESQQQQMQQNQTKKEDNQEQEDAAQILNALKENEKNLLQERMKTKYSGIKKEKDW